MFSATAVVVTLSELEFDHVVCFEKTRMVKLYGCQNKWAYDDAFGLLTQSVSKMDIYRQ